MTAREPRCDGFGYCVTINREGRRDSVIRVSSLDDVQTVLTGCMFREEPAEATEIVTGAIVGGSDGERVWCAQV